MDQDTETISTFIQKQKFKILNFFSFLTENWII